MRVAEAASRARPGAPFAALLVAAFLIGAAAPPAGAMSFSTLTRPDGTRIVLAEGPVADGDAARLRVALQAADRDPAGYKLLALDGPGGAIVEAFALVEKSGGSCASACAPILFLSGAHRTIEGSGRLGLHSCHTAGDRSRSVACNELIAQNALARGTPYASIMVFLHLTGPTQMKWLGAAEAGPLGFTRKPPDVPQVASAYRM